MAVMINGAVVMQNGRDWGVEVDGEIVECATYDLAERLADQNDRPVKVRYNYQTDWTDAR